jgi:hypothetical protein
MKKWWSLKTHKKKCERRSDGEWKRQKREKLSLTFFFVCVVGSHFQHHPWNNGERGSEGHKKKPRWVFLS